MSTRQKKDIKAYALIFPCVCLLLSIYFIHHSLSGKYSLNSRNLALEKALDLEFQLVGLRQERDLMAKRVQLLRNGSIEKDMLDEQARHQLNLIHPDEIVLPRK